jgi:hypothetical protein
MDMRGQGAIEYLLIIGAAILVVAVVIIALTSVTSTAGEATGGDDVNAAFDPLCEAQCNGLNGDYNALGCFTEDGNKIPLAGNC